jgi:hypothetical protein
VVSAFDPAVGPYQSERDAADSPMCREVRHLHEAGLVRFGDPDRLVRDAMLRYVQAACDEAGLVLGRFDRQVLSWLANWEPAKVQVLIGLIRRAYASGRGETR